MATNALALRMKYRKLDASKLTEIVNDKKSSELEVKVAQECLDKLNVNEAPAGEPVKKVPAKKAEKKSVPKKATKAEEPVQEEGGSREEAMKRQNKKNASYESNEQLTEEEAARLAAAEEEYEKRQSTRKTPSKSDKGMKSDKAVKADKTPRETKRENLDASEEIPGLKIGSKVKAKGEDTVGEITRLYKSGDGKEKCMVKFGDDKPVKKRVTALELAEEVKEAPAKKTPKKK